MEGAGEEEREERDGDKGCLKSHKSSNRSF